MKQYSDPKIEVRRFDIECIVTASLPGEDALDVWKDTNNGVVTEKSLTNMHELNKILVF